MPQVEKTIRIRGKNYKYTNSTTLANKLNVDKKTATELIKEYRKYGKITRIIQQNKKVAEIDISERLPRDNIIYREFKAKRILTKDLLTQTKLENKQGTKNITLIKDKTLLKINSVITFKIKTSFTVRFSDDLKEFNTVFTFNTKPKNMNEQFIKNYIINVYLKGRGIENVEIVNINVEYYTANDKQINISNMTLREPQNNLNISNLYNDVIDYEVQEHCVKDFINNKYKSQLKKYKKFNAFFNSVEEWDTETIYSMCEQFNIKLIAFDILGNIIKSFMPKKRSYYKPFNFIAYNGHLYPVPNNYLQKTKYDKYENIIIENAKQKLIEFLEKQILVDNVKIVKDKIISFTYKNFKYIENEEYARCNDILKQFGVEDKIYDNIKISNLGDIIANLYIKENVNSIFPFNEEFAKGGFNYNNDNLKYNEDFLTIDKNKAYAYILKELPELIKCNIITDDEITDNLEIENLNNNYLYIVEVKKSCLLIPDNNIYTGEFLKYCHKKGIEFTVIKGITTTTTPNYYKQLIIDLYTKLSNEEFKQIYTALIGRFECYNGVAETFEYSKIVNEEELKTINNFTIKLNDNYTIALTKKEYINIYNKKPIAIQIKDNMRRLIYEMIETLKINKEDIKQIKTDALTFKMPDNFDLEAFKRNYISKTNIDKWKIEKYTPINEPEIYNNNNIDFYSTNTMIQKNNILGLCYAGAGKTYKIINEIVPTLKDFIVLSPSHSSLTEYKQNNILCCPIQTFEFNKKTPEQQTIIIDEFGMCSTKAHELILKWGMSGKRIIAYGDYSQLDNPQNNENIKFSSLFFNMLFNFKFNTNKIYEYTKNADKYANNNIDILTTNYRNNFTIDYYEGLKTNEDTKYIIKQVNKYSSNKSTNIICYRNATAEKYNKEFVEKYGFEKNNNYHNARVICLTNEYREQGLFNNYALKVYEKDDEFYLYDESAKYEFTKEKFLNAIKNEKFNYSYARTIYRLQGLTLNNYKWANEDNYFINNKVAYVVISRIKQ